MITVGLVSTVDAVQKALSRDYSTYTVVDPAKIKTMSVSEEEGSSVDIVPSSMRNMRACLLCSLIKTCDQFEVNGCENCEEWLQLKGDRERVYNCTSSAFEGIISLMQPNDSWVAKWQHIVGQERGVYALSVDGKLPPSIVTELKIKGKDYKIRNTSVIT